MTKKLPSSNSAVSWPVPTRSVCKEVRVQHTELIFLKQWCIAKNELTFPSFQNINKVTLTLLQYLSCRGNVQGGKQIWWLCLQFFHGVLELPQTCFWETPYGSSTPDRHQVIFLRGHQKYLGYQKCHKIWRFFFSF